MCDCVGRVTVQEPPLSLTIPEREYDLLLDLYHSVAVSCVHDTPQMVFDAHRDLKHYYEG